mmetsp:Transcript_3903/g.3843  ORF Transcript_3903/g.3843 Transcript_3903/m.3843 type:complete len:188 (+) Transcript_3903:177-740(+)
MSFSTQRKKGSSSGSDDDRNSYEEGYFFRKEEQIIKNHLKLNATLQFISMCIFMMAICCCYWAHVKVEEEVYHFKLFTMFGNNEFVWTYNVTLTCNENMEGEETQLQYPEEVCQRAPALFVSGFFTAIGLTGAIFINIYTILSLALFSLKFTLDKLQSVCISNLHLFYIITTSFYFMFSTKFFIYFY